MPWRGRLHQAVLALLDLTFLIGSTGKAGVFANGAMGAPQIRQHCRMGEAAKELLRAAIQQLGLSARASDRTLKLARTVADLAGSEGIEVEHVAEAIQYRTLDRTLWG
jgi:magnesium chelatase family protein